MISTVSLKTYTAKDLAQMAKRKGVTGWHSMRKDQLIRALIRLESKATKAKEVGKSAGAKGGGKANGYASKRVPVKAAVPPKTTIKRVDKKAAAEQLKPLPVPTAPKPTAKPTTTTTATKVKPARFDSRHAVPAPHASSEGKSKSKEGASKPSSPGKTADPMQSKTRLPIPSTSNGTAKRVAPIKKGTPVIASGKKNGVKLHQVPPHIEQVHREKEKLKDLSSDGSEAPVDRIVLMVRDAYWLHAYWEVSTQAIIRARAAMAEQWHTAEPVLRVHKTTAEGKGISAAESIDRDIRIHGGVNNWYIDVQDPPQTYRAEIGYLSSGGRFFSIARSNLVTTPSTNSADLVDHNWTDVAVDCDRILAQSGAFSDAGNDGELQKVFEERLRRPMGSPMMTRYGVGAEAILSREREFSFELDAEMIVYGCTQPDCHVMVGGQPIKVRSDGTFSMRMSMSEGRQVLPVISCTGDGTQQQTIILAVERNTKTMEPVDRESAQ